MGRRKRPAPNGNRKNKNKKQKYDDEQRSSTDRTHNRQTSVERKKRTIETAIKVKKDTGNKTSECEPGLKTEQHGHVMITRKKKRDQEKQLNSKRTELKQEDVKEISSGKNIRVNEAESDIQQTRKSREKLEKIVKKLHKKMIERNNEHVRSYSNEQLPNEPEKSVDEENCNTKLGKPFHRRKTNGKNIQYEHHDDEENVKEDIKNKTQVKKIHEKQSVEPSFEVSETEENLYEENANDKATENIGYEAQPLDFSTFNKKKKRKRKYTKQSHSSEIYKPSETVDKLKIIHRHGKESCEMSNKIVNESFPRPSKSNVGYKKTKKKYPQKKQNSEQQIDISGKGNDKHYSDDSAIEKLYTHGVLEKNEHLQGMKQSYETTEYIKEMPDDNETDDEFKIGHPRRRSKSKSSQMSNTVANESFTSKSNVGYKKKKKYHHKKQNSEQQIDISGKGNDKHYSDDSAIEKLYTHGVLEKNEHLQGMKQSYETTEYIKEMPDDNETDDEFKIGHPRRRSISESSQMSNTVANESFTSKSNVGYKKKKKYHHKKQNSEQQIDISGKGNDKHYSDDSAIEKLYTHGVLEKNEHLQGMKQSYETTEYIKEMPDDNETDDEFKIGHPRRRSISESSQMSNTVANESFTSKSNVGYKKKKKKYHHKKQNSEQQIDISDKGNDKHNSDDSAIEKLYTHGVLEKNEHLQGMKQSYETTEYIKEMPDDKEIDDEFEIGHPRRRSKSESSQMSNTVANESFTRTSCKEKKKHNERDLEHVDTLCEGNGKKSSEKIMPDRQFFQFQLSQETWSDIKPISKTYSNGRVFRRMGNKWTDPFQDEVNIRYPGCVLLFKTHHVKSTKSRKRSGAFLLAIAICKGSECNGKFHFVIDKEPNTEDNIIVDCTVSGYIMHSVEEVNRRHITGSDRELIGQDCRKKSASKVYYQKVLSGNTEQMSLGNYTSVPNETVLRKMISEIIKKEQLHSNILAELQVLKESYDKSHDPYIREIGYDPFYLIMISDRQIELLKKLSDEDDLYIYLDATGSVISNIVGQKRPYLYSFVVKPNTGLPPVSLADMISTQHTIPRIELFLLLIKRSVNVTGKMLRVKKVETDYSLALIQASLHTFSNLSVKTYLLKCMDIIKSKSVPSDFTVHHLCAAHMIKDFSRQLTKYKPRTKKKLRKFILKCFAALQNTTSLQETKKVYRDISTVMSSSKTSAEVKVAIQELKEQFQTKDVHVCEEDEDISIDEEESDHEDVEEKTIKDASPFTNIFQKITSETIQLCATHKLMDSGDNELYSPEAVQCLLEKFMATVPMWSGIMLSICNLTTDKRQEDELMCRDTNSPAENWFKFIKCDLKTPKHARPYTFVTNLREAIESRLKEHLFPGCRKKKTRRKNKKETDAILSAKEELWKPRRQKGVYHTTPNMKKVPKKKGINDKGISFPRVMKWGGKLGETVLANTCTIDNVLTILHLYYCDDEQFQYFMKNDEHSLSKTLLTVFSLMSEEEFSAAKIVWVDYIGKEIKPSINLYGDEYELIITHIDNQWKSMTVSACDNPSCVEQMKESREVSGITVGMSTPFISIQELIDKWMKDTVSCAMECSTIDEPFSKLAYGCHGDRTIQRRLLSHPPILVVRVYEHCLMNRLSINDILAKNDITINHYSYSLAGLTLHKQDHYTAIVISKTHGPLWFDGLIGELRHIPQHIDSWFPSHVFFGRVR